MKSIILVLLVISLIANIFLGLFIVNEKSAQPLTHIEARSTFPLLSQRIFLQDSNDILLNFVPLREKLRAYDNSQEKAIGIYFEYLPSGTSIGVNEKEEFVLASLLKVPLVMAAYKQVERGKMKMDDTLTVKEENLDPFFGNLWKKGAGTELSLREAIGLTLMESDNTAKSVIFNALPEGALEEVFDYLDIPKELESNEAVVTAKNYSSVLRSLYLSSYLLKSDSNEMLETLTRTKFTDMLPAGVADNIKVAHKIGVYEPTSSKSAFTDCGIIYIPKRPYMLCVMMHGSELEAKEQISSISKLVYEYVSMANK